MIRRFIVALFAVGLLLGLGASAASATVTGPVKCSAGACYNYRVHSAGSCNGDSTGMDMYITKFNNSDGTYTWTVTRVVWNTSPQLVTNRVTMRVVASSGWTNVLNWGGTVGDNTYTNPSFDTGYTLNDWFASGYIHPDVDAWTYHDGSCTGSDGNWVQIA